MNFLLYYMTSFSKDLKLLFFSRQGSFLQTNISPPSRKFSTSQNFHKPRFFRQGSFPKTNIFFPSKKFSTSQYFAFVEEVFHKQIFFPHQGSFPQKKIFFSSRKFSTKKDVSLMKRLFHKQGDFSGQSFYIHTILKILTCLMVRKGHMNLTQRISFCVSFV